jgi:hypothetical protein
MNKNRSKGTQKLLPIEETRVAKIIEGKLTEMDAHLKKGLPIISCECGAEILVVPDLKAMNQAFKTHITEHRKKERNTQKKIAASSKIDELLSQLTIIKLSKQNNI